MSGHRHLSCHACDELVTIKLPEKEGRYRCPVCGHTLFKNYKNSIEKSYAISIASFILFLVANYFPILTFNVVGQSSSATFMTAIKYLYQDGDYIMTIAVLMTTIVVPFTFIVLTMIVFGMLYHNKIHPIIIPMLRVVEDLRPWGMLDVFLVGTLVSIVKLVKMGSIHFGYSFWAFVALVPLLAYAHMILDPHRVWEMIEDAGICPYQKDKQ